MSESFSLSIEGPTPEPPVQPAPAPSAVATGAVNEIVLRGATADAYVKRLQRGILAARLNAFCPPSTALRAHVGFLGASGSRGLYEELHLSATNALPTAREVLRVKIDKELVSDFLADAAKRNAPPPGSRMAARISYYSELAQVDVMPVNRMSVELRRRLPEESFALFRVVFDRFDLAGNQFVRYTILLGQRDRFWGRRHVELARDIAAATDGFRRIVGRFASHEAELAFVLLSEVEGIEVEDVRRCRVGPLLLPGARVGQPLEALLDADGGPCAKTASEPWILCFPEDRAGVAVSRDTSLDPFAPLFRDAISGEARALVDAKAKTLGYRVTKARKFVCARPLQKPLKQACREMGAPSIVRGV